jgi:hypothetical protein
MRWGPGTILLRGGAIPAQAEVLRDLRDVTVQAPFGIWSLLEGSACRLE